MRLYNLTCNLQEQKQEYAAEYARLQEASQAAAEALRQRLRRMTSDRNRPPTAVAGQSATSAASSQQPAAVAPVSTSQPEHNLSSQTPPGATGHVPQSSTLGQSPAGTAGTAGLRSSWSNTRLSDSWGSSPPMAAATAASASDFTSAPHQTSSLASSGLGLEQDPARSAEQKPLSDARLKQAEQPAAQHADYSAQSVQSTMGRPPKAASSSQSSSLIDQQGSGQRQNVDAASAQTGLLPTQMGRKASLMSAGSGYQADSDSNSDTQVEPSIVAQLTGASQAAPQEPIASAAGSSQQAELVTSQDTAKQAPSAPLGAADSAPVDTESESRADKPAQPPSLFGRATELVSNTVWGAAHPIQAVEAVASIVAGHTAEAESEDKPAATATGGTITEPTSARSSSAFAEASDAQREPEADRSVRAGASAAAASAQQPQKAESGYQSDLDHSQAALDAPAVPPAEDRPQNASITAFPSTPTAIKTSLPEDQADSEQRTTTGAPAFSAQPHQVSLSSCVQVSYTPALC